MADSEPIRNVPQEFEHFVAAPPHRLFAVFDDPEAGDEAIAHLHAEGGFTNEDDTWVFFGEEGSRRLDVSGSAHGIHAEIIRLLQRLMSSDVNYLRSLDQAVRDGHLVVAVVVGHDSLEHVAEVLRGHGGHSLARVAHWDYVPVRT